VRALALVCLVGCLGRHFRYIDLPLPPEQAKAEIKADAAGAELAVVDGKTPCEGAPFCDDNNLQLWRGTERTEFLLAPRGTGSRLEIVAGNGPLVLTPGLSRRPVTELHPRGEAGWADRFVFDYELSAQVERDPRVGLGWRTNFIGQAGGRVLRWGELGDAARTGYSMSILAGPGLTIASTGPSLLPELTLEFDRQSLVSPMPGEHLPMGPRDAIDLSIAGRFLDDEQPVNGSHTYRNGIEGALTVRRVGLGGVTMRAGYLFGPGGGKTYAIGVRAVDPWHGLLATLAVAGVAIVVLAVTHPPTINPSGG
jgi:hypothetical protein